MYLRSWVHLAGERSPLRETSSLGPYSKLLLSGWSITTLMTILAIFPAQFHSNVQILLMAPPAVTTVQTQHLVFNTKLQTSSPVTENSKYTCKNITQNTQIWSSDLLRSSQYDGSTCAEECTYFSLHGECTSWFVVTLWWYSNNSEIWNKSTMKYWMLHSLGIGFWRRPCLVYPACYFFLAND